MVSCSTLCSSGVIAVDGKVSNRGITVDATTLAFFLHIGGTCRARTEGAKNKLLRTLMMRILFSNANPNPSA